MAFLSQMYSVKSSQEYDSSKVLPRQEDLVLPNPFYVPNLVIQIVVVTISTAFVVMKCVVRRAYLRTWTTEDNLMVVSWALLMAYIATNTYQVNHGGGQVKTMLTPYDVLLIKKWSNFSTIVYSVTMAFSRSAVLVTYINIFTVKIGPSVSGRNDYRNRRTADYWFVVVIIAVNAIFYTCSMFLKIFVCHPREAIWNPSVHGVCMNVGALLTASSVWNTFSDLVVLILPLLFVRRIKISARAKWQIMGIFTLGAISYPLFSIAGLILRTLVAFQPDQIYWLPRVLVYSEAEIAAGLICACVPSVTYLLKRWRTRPSVYRGGSSERRGSNNRRRNTYWHLDPSCISHDGHESQQHAMAAVGQKSAAITQDESSSCEELRNDVSESDVSDATRNYSGTTWIELDPPATPQPTGTIMKTTKISIRYDQNRR